MKTLFASLAFLLLPVGLFAQLGGQPYPVNSAGVTYCAPVKFDTTGKALAATTSDVGTPMSIAMLPSGATCGTTITTGSVFVAKPGAVALCTMDNTVSNTAYVYILNSTTTTHGSRCIASTAAPSGGTFIIGYLTDPSGGTVQNNTALVTLAPDIYGGGSGGGPPLGTPGQIPVMNSAASAYAPLTMTGDCSFTDTGDITCLESNGVPFGPLATAAAPLPGLLDWNGSSFGSPYTVGYAANNIPQLNSSAQLPVNVAGLYQASALPNGTSAVTQANGDNSTKVATTAYVAANAGSYPSGTGVVASNGGSSWPAVYNASNPIPINFLAGTAAYQWFYSGGSSPYGVTALSAPVSPSSVYQVPCSIPGSAPTLCPPGVNTASITISTSATLPAADANFQVTLLGSGILNIPTTTTLGLPKYAVSLINATSSAITLCAGYSDSTCNTTSTGSQIQSATAQTPAASISLPADSYCLLTAVSSTLWQCNLSGAGGITGATANGGLLQTGSTLGLLTSCSTGQVLAYNSSGIWVCSSPAVAFNQINSATNTTAAMVVGTGATLSPAGSGQIEANTLAATTASIAPTTSMTIGTASATSSSALGNTIIAAGGNSGTGLSGGVLVVAGSANSAGPPGAAGSIELVPGTTQDGAVVTQQGLLAVYESFETTTTIAAFNLVCLNSTTKTVNTCAATPNVIAGVATASVVPAGNVDSLNAAVAPSDYFINASAAVTVGHTVCAGSTAGKVTDSGGTSACPSGQITVGVVEDISNTYKAPDGSTATASSTLPLVQMTSMQAGSAVAPAWGNGFGAQTASANVSLAGFYTHWTATGNPVGAPTWLLQGASTSNSLGLFELTQPGATANPILEVNDNVADCSSSSCGAVAVDIGNTTTPFFTASNNSLIQFSISQNSPSSPTVTAVNCGLSGTTQCNFNLYNGTSGALNLAMPSGALGSLTQTWAKASGIIPVISSPTGGKCLQSSGTLGLLAETSTACLAISGTLNSGGIIYGNSSSTVASSATLTQYGVLFGGGTGGAPTASAAGTSGYPLLSGGSGANGAYGQLNLAGSGITGNLGIANGGTNASTAANALINLLPTAAEVGDILYCSAYSSGCTAWTLFSGNTSGTKYLSESSAGVPAWSSSTSGVTLNAITAASGTNTIANGNNYGQIWDWALTTNSEAAMVFGETTAATGTGDAILEAATLSGSTANPVAIVQGSVTGTTSIPALSITTTLNNSSLVDNVINLAVTNTSSSTSTECFIDMLAGTAGTTQNICLGVGGNIGTSSGLTGTANTTNVNLSGGTITSGTNGTVGGMLVQGSDDNGAGSSVKAGYAILRGGGLTNASPSSSAQEGLTQVVTPYVAGTTTTAGLAMCMTTTQWKVSACGTGPAVNFVGVSAGTSGGTVYVVTNGQAIMTLSAALTAIGDTVCLSTGTAGNGTDSGGQGVCSTAGAQVGIIAADSGTIYAASGSGTSSYTLSTTSVVVELHPR